MAEFPKQIDCGGFELIKPEATFDKAKEFFDIVTKNKEFLAEWLEWVGLYTQPEVAFNYLNSISDVKEPSYLIQVNGKVIGGHGFVDVNKRYKIAEGKCIFNGVIFEVDDKTSKVTNIKRIYTK